MKNVKKRHRPGKNDDDALSLYNQLYKLSFLLNVLIVFYDHGG